MRIAGVEIKGSEAIIAVIENADGQSRYLELNPKRIPLHDDKTESVKDFASSFDVFVRTNRVDYVVIKSRAKGGEFAGGAMGFKIEGIIQATCTADVVLIAPQTIAACKRKAAIVFPGALNKYQQEAYAAASSFRA